MEREYNADPEIGPEPGLRSDTSKSQEDPPPKRRSKEDNNEELIPLTHKPPLPSQTSASDDENTGSHPVKKPPVPRLIHP